MINNVKRNVSQQGISKENIASETKFPHRALKPVSKLRQLSGGSEIIETYELNVEFTYIVSPTGNVNVSLIWEVEPIPGEGWTYFQDFVLVDERAEGRLFRGLPMPSSFYTSDAQQYAGFPFAFIPNGLDINWVSLQRPSYFAAPCAFIRKYYIEADLLLWSSMSGWSIPEFLEYMDREQFEDGPLYR